MKRSIKQSSPHALRLASVLATIALSSSAAFAADAYLDINGTTAGSGLTVAAGSSTWSTSIWSSDSTGASATVGWTDGDNAIFSAGTDANNNVRTLSITAVTVGNLTQEEGRVSMSGGTVTLAGTSVIYDVKTRTTADYDLLVNSVIANSAGGASSITKNGAGILQLNANNTFTGGVTLNQGTLAFGDSAGTYFGSGTLTLAGGNFIKKYGPATNTEITVANALNVTGTVNVGVVQQRPGNIKLTGTWGAGNSSAVFNVGNTAIEGLAILSSTIIVQGDASAYTGTFAHNTLAGTAGNRLRFGAANAGSTGYNASNAKFATSGSTSGNNVLDLADGTYGTFKMGELSGTGGRIRAGWATGGNTTFEIGALNTSTSFAGNIDNNVNGAGGLAAVNKVGSGTFTVTGAQGYTGGTTITAGTFAIGASDVLQNGGKITLAGGTLAINSGFTDTVGVLDLDASSTISIGSGATLIFADSNTQDWGGFSLSISGTFVSGSSIKFATSGGLSSGQLAQISSNGYTNFGLDGSGFLTASAIPEPSTFAIIAGFAVLGATGFRRRRAG